MAVAICPPICASSCGPISSVGARWTRSAIGSVADAEATLGRGCGSGSGVTAGDSAAVAGVRTVQPDVALLDLGMPHVSGYDAARLSRQQPGGDAVFRVALTGWGQDADKRRSSEAGFDAHLVKPADVATIEKLLQSSAADASRRVRHELIPDASDGL